MHRCEIVLMDILEWERKWCFSEVRLLAKIGLIYQNHFNCSCLKSVTFQILFSCKIF